MYWAVLQGIKTIYITSYTFGCRILFQAFLSQFLVAMANFDTIDFLSTNSTTLYNFGMITVEPRSKGTVKKGNPPKREMIQGPISYFLIYFYIGYKGISVFGKNWAGPLKSLGEKLHCMFIRSQLLKN